MGRKPKDAVEIDGEKDAEVQVPDVPDEAVAVDVIVPTTAPMPLPPTGRRAPGHKEVIPFRWKVCGYSDGYTVTLFKSVDKADAESQLDRLQKEQYYGGLAIYPIDEVPPPAPGAKAARTAREEKAKADKRAAAAHGKKMTPPSKGAPAELAASGRTFPRKPTAPVEKASRKAAVAGKRATARTAPKPSAGKGKAAGKTKKPKAAKPAPAARKKSAASKTPKVKG
jgi:hypothetical protein